MRFLCGILLVGFAVAFAPSDLTGQVERDGFFIGFGLGLGSLGAENEDERESALSGYLKLGGAVNDRVLLGAETNGWTKTESEEGLDVTLTLSSLLAVAYFYPNPSSGLFLKGGLGWTRLEGEVSVAGIAVSESENGTALTLGIGFDHGLGGRFALTPFANLIYSDFEGGTTNLLQAGIGVSWY